MRKTPEKSIKLPKPFIKWAGGKSKLVPHIIETISNGSYDYYEPFVGGGAVFFALVRLGYIKSAHLNDANTELVNVYITIRDRCDDLITELSKSIYQNDKSSYMSVRISEPSNDIESAARFIYLNKTCFNGLYRVNKKGKFNVPFGRYKNPVICDSVNLRSVSDALKSVEITNLDFIDFFKRIRKDSLVYIDPPYLPISTTSNFTEYTEKGFSISDHEELAGRFKDLTSSGSQCILSNSSSEYCYDLYKGFKITTLTGPRTIGGSVNSRKSVQEILVTR